MALYDYRCKKCDNGFEAEMSPSEVGKKAVRCPKCKSRSVERLYTAFFAKTSRKS